MSDKIRKEFERITESTYEGDFTTYANGDYVNEIQQYQWEGFHDGWQAAYKASRHDELVEMLEIFSRATYPVSKEINPRGYNWSEAYLDEALVAYQELLKSIEK